MANAGDTFTVELNQAQLEWGTFRFTGSRGLRYGEGYLKIPKTVALNLQLFNGNHTNGYDITFDHVRFSYEKDKPVLRDVSFTAKQGCSNAGDPYAKQFAGDKDLMALGYWYSQINAQIGDLIRVTFTSPADVVLEKL